MSDDGYVIGTKTANCMTGA